MGIVGDCLDALARQTLAPAEVVVVDDASTDGSVDWLHRTHPWVRVLSLPVNVGFGGAVNHAMETVRTPFVSVLNSDAVPRPDWVAHIASAPRPDRAWAWGSVLLRPDSTTIESAGDLWLPSGVATKWLQDEDVSHLPSEPYDVFAPPGAAPTFRTAVFRRLGGYDESFRMYYEDVDLAFRARRAGHRVVMVPGAHVEHALGATSQRRWSHNVFRIGRNRLVCWARNDPQPDLRLMARGTHRQLRWARSRGVGAAYLCGWVAGVPRALIARREGVDVSADAVLLIGSRPDLAWPGGHDDELE